MFAIPQGDEHTSSEGMLDDSPIFLDGMPTEEFEALLQVLYPLCVPLSDYCGV
jgi:hypothetical protein